MRKLPVTGTVLLTLILAAAPPGVAAAREHRVREGAALLAEFGELLAIPNVARDPVNIRRNAEFIAAAFEKRGVPMDVLSIGDAPPNVPRNPGPS